MARLHKAIKSGVAKLATPAVVQNATTAPVPTPLTCEQLLEKLRDGSLELVEPGTGSTPSTGTLEDNLRDDIAELTARNAALEENALHMEAELRRREEQLVEAGKAAEVRDRECEALRAANTNLLQEVDELKVQLTDRENRLAIWAKDYNHLQGVNSRNAERMYEAEAKAEELEADNTRLRTALLEQATCFATTLKALLPEA